MTSEATQLPVEASATDDHAEKPSVDTANDISSSEPERRQSISADEVSEKAGNEDVDNNPIVDDNAVQSADVGMQEASPSRDPAPSPIPPPPPSSVDEQLATTEETKTNAESQQPLTVNSIPPVATTAIADESVKEDTPATQQESSVDATTSSQLVASDEVVPPIITTTTSMPSSPPVEPKEEKLDDDEVKEVVPDNSKEAMEITNPDPVPQDAPKEPSSSTTTPKDTVTTTPPGRRVFQCSSCNTYYEDWNLFLHMRNVHNRFICLLCLGLFPNAKRLAKHLLNRHGLSDNHFQDTKDMLAWNDHRPCHMMCVSCESVEECGVDGKEGQTHSCGAVCAKKAPGMVPPVTGDSKSGAPGQSQQLQLQKKSSRRQARMNKEQPQERSNKEGDGGVVSNNNNSNNTVSSDLVPTASTSSGFKLKIKGLSSNNNNIQEGDGGDGGVVVQTVMEASNENPQEDGQEVDPVPGDDNNNMDMDIDKDLCPNPVEVSQEEPGTDDQEGQKKESESGAFSFNFILSKKGLVRNPNPSRRKLDTSMSSDQEEATGTRHSGTAEEGDKEQSQSLAGSSGSSDQVKKEAGEEVVVPPLLVSKLKLKIPKYIVPVESSDDEEEDEEDESESGDEESGNNGDTEDEEKSSSQFRPVKEEVMDESASKEVPRSPGGSDAAAKDSSQSGGGVVVKEEVDGVAVDRHNTENGQGASSSNGKAGGGEIKTEAAVDPKLEDNERKGSISLSVAMEIDDTDAPFTLSGIKSDDDVSSKDPTKDNTAPTEESPPEEDIPLIDADGLHLAHPTSQSFELSLDQPLDHIPAKEFLRICLRSTIPFCLYCYHARRIAVNAKMLAVHMIATHRFTALVDSITAEELMNNTIVARLKSSLEEMADLYFNLDDYDSDIVAPLKMKAKIFECFQCRFTTGTHKELYLHNRKLHLKTVLLCLMCRSTFYNYSELLCHICPGVASRDLNYDLQFRCYYCNVNDLPSAFRLMVHLRKAHAVCEVCLEECFDQTRLSNHAWKHKLHHFCYRCGIAYRNKQDITRHLFWKHGTESELCKKCLQKRWPHIYHFCLPPMQFNCDQCVLTFSKAVHLRVHKRLHQEESPHVCAEENCEERFISKRMLEKHGRVHLGLPPEGGDGGAEGDGGGGEGNANGMDVEKEEIIGGGGSSKGGASDNEEGGGGGPDPIMAMPVPNLSESDSSDDEEENSRASSGGQRPGGGNLLQGMQMTRLSDSDSEDTDAENGQKKTRSGSVNTALLEGNTLSNNNSRDSLMSSGKTNPEKMQGDVEVNDESQSKEAGENKNILANENNDQKGDLLTSSTENVNNKLTTDHPTSAISRQITSKSLDPVDSSDEDGERSKTKAIIDIWENFRSYQATQIQQQRQSDDEEEDLIAPLPPPILHVLQSDHDYGLMYKVYSRIDDDQDLKEIQDIEMMRRSGKLFKSSANCDSDSSACSCGTKCSCKSAKSNSSSSSSSSNSSSSSSSSSSEEDESKMTKKQKLIRAQRKAKRRARKLKKTLEANGGVLNAAETDNLLLSINDEVVTRLPETDLETDESDTDEEFYDANPYKIAQERIAEKNKQEEEAEEEKRSRREKRRKHRQARREAKLRELEEKTGAALESRLEAVAAAVNSENSRNVSMVTAINTPTTTPNVVPKLRLTFSAKFKKEQQERVNGGTMPGLQRSRTNSPVVNDQMMRFSHTPPPAVMNNYHHPNQMIAGGGGIGFVHKYNHNNNINSGTGFGTPISTQQSSLNNDEDSSSSSSNVKRSKRRRIPNKFYGYEGSDDEGSAAQLAMLTGQVPTTPGGPVPMMFRPTPPPNLTWNKEDLPSGAGGFTGTQSGVHNSSGSRMSVDSKLEGVVTMRRDEFPPAAKKQRRQSQQAERIVNHSRPVFNQSNLITNMGNHNMISKGPPAALLSNVDEELDEDWNAEEEDDDDEDDDDLELDDGLRTKQKRKHNNTMMTLMNSDNNTANRDLMITSGRTPKINLSNSAGQQQQMQRTTHQYQSQQPNSFHGVFAAQATKAAPEEAAFRGRQQQSRHPQLVGQLQPAVRNVIRPEPAVPRLKIRSTNNNGVVMKQQHQQMSSASHSSRPTFSNSGSQNMKKQQQQQQQIQQVQQTNETASSDLYCYCRRPYVGEMIGCDGEGCHIEWFHFECVGILMAPQGKWFCPDCSQRRRPMTNGRQSTSSSSAFSMIDRV